MDQNDINDLEQFQDNEARRERERQIRYQESLGPTLTWRERELRSLDMFEAQWKRGLVARA